MTPSVQIHFGIQRKYPPFTIILNAGKPALELFLIKKGCVRAWFNKDGVDITLQFFFEGDTVTSLESFLEGTPSTLFLETIEETEVQSINRKDFLALLEQSPDVKDWFYGEAVKKLLVHARRLLSLLQYKPFERYQQLLDNDSPVLKRVPQQFIASYLGITPVSLSRIKHRKK